MLRTNVVAYKSEFHELTDSSTHWPRNIRQNTFECVTWSISTTYV